MDDYTGIKAICVLVRDDKRLTLGGSTVAELGLNTLLHGIQRDTYHSSKNSLARATDSSEAGHIAFP